MRRARSAPLPTHRSLAWPCLALGLALWISIAPLRAAGPRLSDAAGGMQLEIAAQETLPPAPSRQLWAISSRHAGESCARDARLEYFRHEEAAGRWLPADHAEFLAADEPGVMTCIYVHGNRVDSRQALRDGQEVWRQLTAGLPAQQPLRLVIWSWPSTQIDGALQDVRVKACVSDFHAWHLAWLVDQIHAETPISLIGYSFGARMVCGSLHLLGGGNLAGHELGQRLHEQRPLLRVALMASALDSPALLPRGKYHCALSQVQHMLVLVNQRDPVLHQYPLLRGWFHQGPPALGYTGFFTSALGCDSGKVEQCNVSRQVGCDHDWRRYLANFAIVARLRDTAIAAEAKY